MSGISALIKETTKRSLTHLPPLEDMSKEVGSESTGALGLDFPASRTVQNKFMLFISHLVCDIFIIAAQQTMRSSYFSTSLVIALTFW